MIQTTTRVCTQAHGTIPTEDYDMKGGRGVVFYLLYKKHDNLESIYSSGMIYCLIGFVFLCKRTCRKVKHGVTHMGNIQYGGPRSTNISELEVARQCIESVANMCKPQYPNDTRTVLQLTNILTMEPDMTLEQAANIQQQAEEMEGNAEEVTVEEAGVDVE